MYEIEIYEDSKARSEVKEYIKNLKNKKSKENRIKLNKIIAYIRILKQYGLSIGEPYIKHIKNDIWELRPLRDRILFAYYDNNKFILLTVFMKDTRKTPINEIEKAEKYLKDYIKRSEPKWEKNLQNGKNLKKHWE